MQVEIAQFGTDPGCIDANVNKIIHRIDKAHRNKSDIVIFPELTIPGYMSLDLVTYPEYIDQNLKGLDRIVKSTPDILAIVGFIDTDKDKLGPDGTPVRYNSAAIIHDRKLLGIVDKTLLPDYDVFFEPRYFQPARDRKVIPYKGEGIGVEICEDLWDSNYPTKVSEDLKQKGADILINISASPFYVGKDEVRRKLIESQVKKLGLPFVYANLVGCQDGYEGHLLFDGNSLFYDSRGRLYESGASFAEQSVIEDVGRYQSFGEKKIEPVSEAAQIYKAIPFGIREYARQTGFSRTVLGLSGGIDSAVTAAHAAKALGSEKVLGISMPSRYSSPESVEDARKLAQNLGIHFEIVPIEQTFSSILDTLKDPFEGLKEDVTEENLQARIRMMILMAYSNKFNMLLLSTSNKTEAALGFTTLYADMSGGVAPEIDLSKERIEEQANHINFINGREIIPYRTITKPPSAELSEGQTDEKSLGDSYKVLSPLVDAIVEHGKTKNELLEAGFKEDSIDRVFKLIQRAEYKRRQGPPGFKITKKSFGVGRRIPICHKFSYK